MDVMAITFSKILLARKYWGSKYTPNTQKYPSTILSLAKGSFVAKSKPFHHLIKDISIDDQSHESCSTASFLQTIGVKKLT